MHRFFVSTQQLQGKHVMLAERQAQQIRQVLRLTSGQRIIVLDDTGWEYEVVLTRVARREAIGEVVARRPAEAEPTVAITLYQSVLKWDRFEWLLQKCTEVGVTRFVPIFTRRSLVHDPEAINPNKVARWRRIIAEAAEQSRRGRLPVLAPAMTLAGAAAELTAYPLALMPWEQAEGIDVRAAVVQAGQPLPSVALMIGPEGGFAEEEVELGRQHGAVPITLGKRILRAETAAVVTASLVLYELGEMA